MIVVAGVYIFHLFICLLVCFFVCQQDRPTS